jgi:predicted Zn-dependent protease
MPKKEKAADLVERIRKLSVADEVEVVVYTTRNALTRFANNVIHQNLAEENVAVSVRTVFDGRTARATTNKIDDEGLKRVVEASENLAKVQHSDPDLLPMADAREGSSSARRIPSRHFERTAAVTPEERADIVRAIVALAEKHRLTAAGIVSTSEAFEGIFNGRGLSTWHTQTAAEISITMLGTDSSGWQKANSPNVDSLDAAAFAESAAQKAVKAAKPREIPPGKYTVILEPAAVLDLVGFMFYDFGGLAVLDQRSFLNDRVGTQLFGKNINIWDDVAHPLQSGAPFDGEGIGRQKVQLVENGVVRRLVYARGTAARMQRSESKDKVGPIAPTGHGFPLPNEVGEAPMNIVFGTTDRPKTVDEMVASTERGILVTRLWYIREVDPYEKIVTGMTRDGTFYVENGRICHGVRNFRFNESLIHMLSNVESMGIPVRASGEESFDMVVPAMQVREFNFTEVTKF